jgi:hypothetical protein
MSRQHQRRRPRHRGWPQRSFPRRLNEAGQFIAHPEYRSVVMGAFLSPWFAVSLGIVIAASMTLAEPHTVLSFPPSKASQCEPGCTGPAPGRAGGPGLPASPAAAKDDKLPSRVAASARAAPRRGGKVAGGKVAGGRPNGHSHGIEVRYGLLREGMGRFMAMFVIKDSKSLGSWTLQFTLPDSKVFSIMWGKWTGGSSGPVVVQGMPSPWPRSAPDQARIVVIGTGSPGWPSNCAFDGRPCDLLKLGSMTSAPYNGLRPGEDYPFGGHPR